MCKSQLQCSPRRRALWIARARREAPPTAPWLRASWAQRTVYYLPFSHHHLPALNSLSVLFWPWRPFVNYLSALNCLPCLLDATTEVKPFLSPLIILNSCQPPSPTTFAAVLTIATAVSTSSFKVPDYTSALWHSDSTRAPSSLLSTVTRQSTSSAGFPC